MPKPILILLGVVAMTGCRTYIPLESVKTEYRTRDSIRYDSIYIRDSTLLREKNDTIYLTQWRDEYRYIYSHRTDTLLVHDSIQVPTPIPTERKLSWWERQKLRWGGWAFALGVGWILYLALRIYF